MNKASSKPRHEAPRRHLPARSKASRGALRLLDSWLKDESGYDERVWPALRQAIDEHRLSARPRFRG